MSFTTIQIRRDTAANWTSVNPVLHAGEMGYETDTGKLKFGDGSTAYNSLPYFTAAGGSVTTTGSPASGNLTKFSGASTITNGDLSGDVTTSGTLAATVAKIQGTTVSGTTGSGNVVFSTSPTLVTPALGTPSALVLTNATGLPVAGGGTGNSTFTAYSVICAGTTATGAFQNVSGLGSSGQVLTSNGAGALPTFQTPGGGSSELVLIATATASSSSTLDFTSDITSSYDWYVFVFKDIAPSTSASISMYFSTNNGSTWTQNMRYARLETLMQASPTSSYGGGSGGGSPATISVSDGGVFHGYVSIYDPSSTSRGSVFESEIGASGGNTMATCVGWNSDNAAATNAVRFAPSSGNFTSGTIYLYGIKNT